MPRPGGAWPRGPGHACSRCRSTARTCFTDVSLDGSNVSLQETANPARYSALLGHCASLQMCCKNSPVPAAAMSSRHCLVSSDDADWAVAECGPQRAGAVGRDGDGVGKSSWISRRGLRLHFSESSTMHILCNQRRTYIRRSISHSVHACSRAFFQATPPVPEPAVLGSRGM